MSAVSEICYYFKSVINNITTRHYCSVVIEQPVYITNIYLNITNEMGRTLISSIYSYLLILYNYYNCGKLIDVHRRAVKNV